MTTSRKSSTEIRPSLRDIASILPEIQKIDRLARILQRRRSGEWRHRLRSSRTVAYIRRQGRCHRDRQVDTSLFPSHHRRVHDPRQRSRGAASGRSAKSLRIYRIHEEPDPAKVEAFAEMVSTFGLKFRPKRVRPAEFQKFISSIEGRPDERMLSYLMLRSFKQAVYSADNVGHFGLASDAYTHFTSPIRRYPDLVVHRILKAAIARRQASDLPRAQLEAIASESSERERIAAQAEREIFEWKKMILMERHLGETFDAVIIAVSKRRIHRRAGRSVH